MENLVFDSVDFKKQPLARGTYENSTFKGCAMAELSLDGIVFSECSFYECDLSMANLKNSSFRDTKFTGCKLLGLRFDQCAGLLISFSFDRCVLDYSSFFKLKLRGTRFSNCKMEEVEFRQADLSQASFKDCNLARAIFEETILDGCDFTSALNYTIDPEKNRMRKAKFSYEGLPGLLTRHGIIVSDRV